MKNIVARYISHVQKAVADAESHISKCSSDILAIDGMSGPCTRHFYNNLVNMEDARYLEIGTWKGRMVEWLWNIRPPQTMTCHLFRDECRVDIRRISPVIYDAYRQ